MLGFLLIFMALGLLLIALTVQKRWSRLRQIASGLLVSYFTVALILGAGELYFRYVFAESDNIITLATQNWLDRYWHTNSFGFRDREWLPADWEGKKTVVVLGDSFAAGWGLRNTDDRFANVLGSKLGDDYYMMDAAVYGTATPEQLEILKKLPVSKPDVVILQYFLNDINYAGLELGLLPTPEPTPEWTRQSYLANFFYWHFIVPANSDATLYDKWWEWSYDAYDNPGIWGVHEQELEDFIDYTDSIGARLIVVIFPNMVDIVRSVPYVDRVAQVFEARGHNDVLKLFDAAADWDPNDLMVSKRDSHPSISFNHYVGEQLYEQFFADNSGTP